MASYGMINMLHGKSKIAKDRRWDVRDSLRKYFNKALAPKAESNRIEHLHMSSTNISMRTILSEMMISLGWDEPTRGTWCVGEAWGCEFELEPKGPYAVGERKRIRIESEDETSEVEATESAARKVTLYLEKVMSIYLIDLNYSKRAQAEGHLAEAESVLELISSLAAEARFDWEALLDDLSNCDEHCYNILMKHEPKNHYNEEYNTKLECAEAVAELYQSCVSDLRWAHERKVAISKWPEKKKQAGTPTTFP